VGALASLYFLACFSLPSMSSAAAQTSAAPSSAITQATLRGAYELVCSNTNNAIYVASMGDIIWALDDRTLAEKKVLRSPDGKSIGLAVDAAAARLYTGGTGAI
jgi:hypothetical protein